MKLRLLVLFSLLRIATGTARAQDPAVTNSDKYKIVFENERVRVLDYTDKPGEKTTLHQHPDALVYALAPFSRKLTFGDGKTVTIESKAGDVTWVKAQKHLGENIGNTATHVLIVELKEPPAPKPKK